MSARVNPLVRWLARAACRVFYRIDCIGAAPGEGATLLLPNHPNSLLDPALVWATAGRDVRFLAKSTLFEGPLRALLTGAGAIPVYRKQDQGVDTARNAEMFAAVAEALANGDAICLFPEGISHSKGRLEPLRTGAARMALAAERAGTPVMLVPVGLNFDRKTAFRSRVTVVFGPPFTGRDLLTVEEAGSPAAARDLTDRIAAHIRLLLIEADPKADAALVERVDRLYAAARGRPADPAERLSRRRTIAAGIEQLRAGDPAKYDELLLRLRRYDQRLRRFGIRDRHLDWQVGSTDAIRFALRELAIAVLLLPLCVAGLVAFFVPYRLTGLAAKLATREHDVIATAQVIAGLVIYGGWVAALAAIAWQIGGRTLGVLTLLAIPPLALGSLFALERESSVADAVRSWILLRRARQDSRERLRRRRSELADVLDQVNRWMADRSLSP
ncbi:MAG TPA: lysophospholipid acyltransferase family protein [Vicinamibacterales bacterium]|jgi:1-acyl-sn-glycerol-3-phosphate acyltransferase|nr:lysophospholipid acyltransferase family protein [Vicinamibacterales bacterium]